MANSLTSNPWVIDTAGAALLFAGDVFVEHFEFVSYAAQGNKAIIQDRFGKSIWVATGAADLEEVRSGKVDKVHGIAVTQLDGGGVVRIYFR